MDNFFSFAIWPDNEDENLLEKARRRQSPARQLPPARPRPMLFETNPFPIKGPGRTYERRTLAEVRRDAPEIMSLFQQRQRGSRQPVMDKPRVQHTANVAHTAASLATIHADLGLNPFETWRAALLHDVGKNLRGFPEPHAELSARIAGPLVGPDWTSAIAKHSTGGYRMTPHEKIMFLADTITPDRGSSKDLQQIRQAARTDVDKALGLIYQSHHNRLISGTAPKRPFAPDRESMGGYAYHNESGGRKIGTPRTAWELVGNHDAHSFLGLNFENKNVREIVGTMLYQLERANRKDRAKILHDWMTVTKDRHAQLFRSWMPALIPLFQARYGDIVREATSMGNKRFANAMRSADIMGRVMNAHSTENIEHLREFFNDDMWSPLRRDGLGKEIFWNNRHNRNIKKNIRLKKSYDFFKAMSRGNPSLSSLVGMEDTDIADHIFANEEGEEDLD